MIKFTVTPDAGEEYELTAGSRDIYVWEKTGKGKTFQGLMENMSMVDLYRVAHIAARRQGMFDGTLDDFTESTDIAPLDEDEPDPTQPGA